MKKIRLPRKVKKMFKNKYIEDWENFVKDKMAEKQREEHIDKIFTKNYSNVYKIFHRTLRHGK